jgi:hypothetical protein
MILKSCGPPLGCPRNKKFLVSVRTKKTESLSFRFFFGLFRETKKKWFRFVLVSFGVSNLFRNKPKQTGQTEKNRNKPKLARLG